MRSHSECLKVLLPSADHKASRPGLPDVAITTGTTSLTCAVCGKVGVSICVKCSKRSYRTAIARSNPLQERDPKLYDRLDEMSQLPLQGNKQLWDELCIEIKAGDFYEYLPILVEIVHEGKWRTDALDAKRWLRGHLARRAERYSDPEEYGPTVNARRRPGGPKYDKRSGALTAFATRPFAEFEVLGEDGAAISAEEVIDRKRLQTVAEVDGYEKVVMPADRESLLVLGRHTLAEVCEASRCARMVDALKHDRPTFDKALANAIAGQQWLFNRMGLDQDEAEVLAVSILLWNAGPRMYLNFLDKVNKPRMRNAWDRLGRRMKNPDFSRDLRCLLRRGLEYEDRSFTAKQALRVKHDGDFRDSNERRERALNNYFLQRFCAWLAAPGVRAVIPSD